MKFGNNYEGTHLVFYDSLKQTYFIKRNTKRNISLYGAPFKSGTKKQCRKWIEENS